ncbi:sugar ABC transporter permease [Dactylosporangium fulvum]|uniref:Sugar ABC transporter permease n=1 Tax=Dactylosporangium fulvum TaxID=53359 RepID=A0ABY5VRI3_9ACTN|nr:sugar ABC transporter permease [Dactylosporangium fulvum]UWP79686.1 sugar ABC transporter permease [Dactylosporangium fulvum]
MGLHGFPPRRRRTRDRDGALAPLFVVPTVGYIAALILGPVVLAVAYAVSDVTVADPTFDWAGLAGIEVVLADPVFWRALLNTCVITAATTLLAVVGGNVVARLMLARVYGRWLVRLCVLLPWVTPVTVSAVAWLWMLDSVYSPLDWAGRQLGLLGAGESVNWLGRPSTAMASVVAVQAWRLTPLTAVIIMAGLVAIPRNIYEAARVDGAGRWLRTRFMTVPLTAPIVAIAALFCAVFTFSDMAVVRVLTNGGPTHSTEVLATLAFRRGIDGGDVGQGAAVALFLLPVLLAATLTILGLVRRMVTR